MVENSSYKIRLHEFCKFSVVMFSEKNTFLLLVIFSVKLFNKSQTLNVFWFSHSWVHLKLLTQNELNLCTFSSWNSYCFCIAEVWHIPQGTADHNLTLVRFSLIFFNMFNANRLCFDNSTRKHGLLYSAEKYWVIRFLKYFFWNIATYFVKLLIL